MRVDDLGMEAGDEIFDRLHDVEQWHGVEAVVGQLAEHEFFGPDLVGSLLSLGVQVLQLLLVGIFAVRVARRHAFGEDGDADLVAFAREARHGAAAAEDLVVRVRGNDQDGAQERASVISTIITHFSFTNSPC